MRSHDAGGCDFPCDPETLADRQSQFWIPSLQPRAVMLSPAPEPVGPEAPTFTLAHLDGLDLRRAGDGWHGLWRVDGVAHQFWLPEAVPDAAAFYVVTLPMDAFLELRAHAARRLWRSLNGRAPGPDFRAIPRNCASFISCPCARSMRSCAVKAIAPSARRCSAFAAIRQIGRVILAVTKPVAWSLMASP
jgi:hypothetical protein